MFTADSESTLGEGTIEERCGGSDRAKQVVPSETTPLLTNAHRQQLSNAAQTQRQHHHTTTEDATYSARNGPMSYVAASAEAFSRTTGIRLEKIKRVLDKESLSFRPSWFQSWKKNSQVLSIDPSSRSKRPPREPLAIFKDLLDLLVAHQVPGPMLFRMQTEFTDRLGHGRTFEAFGVSEKRFLKNLHIGSLQPDRIKDIESIAKALPKIAVKRAYVDDLDASRRSASSAPTTATRAFGQQLYCVEREIKNLCNPALRGHPNIVRLLAWGLCLDTLEDVSGSVPRIPLLVLERANHSLVDFIEARPMSNSTDAEGHLYAKISLDIGQGLSAIHDAGMIHGDVKLQNILMFHEEGNWVAKLSDFGLTVAAHPDSGTGYDVDYRGTPRWCPPPGSSRYVLGDLFSFDYFAYGLVLWCLFLNRTTSPMPPDDAILEGPEGPFAPINLYNTAMAQLLRANGAVSNRTRLIMRSCIHDDPRLWRTRPWRYLDPEKFPVIGSVSDSVTFPILAVSSFKKLLYQSAVVMATSTEYSINVSRIVVRQVVREPVRLTTHALPTLSTVYTLERAAGTWAGLRRVFTKHWSERRREVESAAKLVKSWRHLAIDPGATNIISHPKTHQCGDYSQLYSSLVSQLIGDATNRSSPRSYALARLRSRIPYCCYQASYHGSEDFVSLALQFPCDIDILAWLCKGEVGRHEVGSLDPHVKFQALEPGSAEIVERFILLAENGYRLDESRWDGVAERRQSLLDAMLCNVWASGLDALPIVHCLSRLQRFAVDRRSSASMPPSLRYFLTGHGLPDTLGEVTQSDTTEFWTTALHECVSLRFYDAVEALVMGGFEVNCLNAEGKTALQTLFETTDLSEDNSHALDRDRIIALLKQRPAKVWHPEFIPSSKQHLPMGWSQIKVRTDPLGADSHRMYQERHFGSLTFQRPTFSFFSDQRLALGFRKVSVPGQTYHLDLLRFITDPLVLPSRSKPIEWKYSDQYYAAEAAKSDELELYTMRWIAVSMVTVCWDLTFWTWTGLQELPSVMAAIVPQSRLAFLIAEILLVPLVRYSPYGFIPLSCTSWMEESRAVKALIDLSALGALCNIIQGSMSYFLAQDGNGYVAASLCNLAVDLCTFGYMIYHGLYEMIHGFIFVGIILNVQIMVLGISYSHLVRDYSTLRLQIIAFTLLLYVNPDQSISSSSALIGRIVPTFLLAHWAIFIAFLGALIIPNSPIAIFASRFPRITDLACFRWLWSGDDDNATISPWRKGYLSPRSRGILTVLLFSSLALTGRTSLQLVSLATASNPATKSTLLCFLIPFATRNSFIFHVIFRKPAWAPKIDYDGVIALTPFPAGVYFSPNASTFCLLTLLYPIAYFAASARGYSLAFSVPLLSGLRLLAVAISFLNAVYLRLRLEVRGLWLDIFLGHCLAYSAYQAYLAATMLNP